MLKDSKKIEAVNTDDDVHSEQPWTVTRVEDIEETDQRIRDNRRVRLHPIRAPVMESTDATWSKGKYFLLV